MNKVIILGNDHTNTVGLVQSFGRKKITVIAVVWGVKTGIVKKSRYLSGFYSAPDVDKCIEIIALNFANSNDSYLIIPGCDLAAIKLEANRDKLPSNILYQYVKGIYKVNELENKELQVKIASNSGFETPWSYKINSLSQIPNNIEYPCLIKPLASYQGSKADLLVCENIGDLRRNLKLVLSRTPEVLLQKYIRKDNEFTIIGCGLKDGRVFIPFICQKLEIYPPKVGLESVIETIDFPPGIKEACIQYICSIGYCGLFSIELMHSEEDSKYYFTECNLRNDGDNGFVLHAGCNVAFVHYADMFGDLSDDMLQKECEKNIYIWDMHHFLSLLHRTISLKQWISDIKRSKGFLMYFPEDPGPFIKQYTNCILQKMYIRKPKYY